jgi:hypothetical protein
MKLQTLLDAVSQKAIERDLKRDTLCRLLRMSIITYTSLHKGDFEKEISTFSPRQRAANCRVIAKLCLFAKEDCEKWLRNLFPTATEMEIRASIKDAQELIGEQMASKTTLIPEDLEFLKLLMEQSTRPVTFEDAYELLCHHRARV